MIEHSTITGKMNIKSTEKQTENQFHNLVHQFNNGILVLSAEKTILYANPAGAETICAAVHELVNKPFPHPIQFDQNCKIELEGKEIFLNCQEIEWKGQDAYLISLHNEEQNLKNVPISTQSQNLFDSMHSPVFALNTEGRILQANPSAQKMMGFSLKELLGSQFYKYFPQMNWEEVRIHVEGSKSFQVPLVSKNGVQLSVETHITQGKWEQEIVNFAVCTDISEQMKLELGLRHAQEQLQLAMFSDFEFLWSMETRKDGSLSVQYVSPSIERVTGFPPEVFVGGEKEWRDVVHPEDQEYLSETYQRRIVEGLRDTIEYRIILPDGHLRWVRDNLKSRRIIENRIRLDGLISDITERKRADEILQQTNEQLRLWVNELKQRNSEVTLLNEMGDLLQSSLSTENIYMVVRQFASELFPEQSGALYILDSQLDLLEAVVTWGDTPPIETVFSTEDCWGLRRNQVQVVLDPHDQIRCDHISINEKRPYLCVPMSAQTETLGLLHLRGKEGQPIDHLKQLALMMAGRIAMALSNIRLSETLRKQSIRDPLTGLFNRRYLEEMLGRELRRAKRYQRPIGLIYLDIDHFKQFNDTFGHGAGDAVLRALGNFLKSQIRGEDIACRYGGEEFIIMFAEASLEDTFHRAQTLCEEVRQIRVGYGDQSLGNITASFGVASFPEFGEKAERLIESADMAMYEAKQTGRNKVVKAKMRDDI